jgi:hypothetical protein
MSERKRKTRIYKTCNQCGKQMLPFDCGVFELNFCNNSKCPNYSLIQLAVEQMPKEKKDERNK